MTIALDGHITGHFSSASSGAVALVTANAADEIVVVIACAESVTVKSVTSDQGVGFSRRTTQVNGTTARVDEWYGGWSSSGTINITVTMSASANFAVAALGISGLPGGTVFDSDSSLPGHGTGTSTSVTTGTWTTLGTSDFGFAGVAIVSNASQSLTKGNVWGSAATAGYSAGSGTTSSDFYVGLEYLVLSAAKSSKASTWTAGSSQAYVAIEDAIVGYINSGKSVSDASSAASDVPSYYLQGPYSVADASNQAVDSITAPFGIIVDDASSAASDSVSGITVSFTQADSSNQASDAVSTSKPAPAAPAADDTEVVGGNPDWYQRRTSVQKAVQAHMLQLGVAMVNERRVRARASLLRRESYAVTMSAATRATVSESLSFTAPMSRTSYAKRTMSARARRVNTSESKVLLEQTRPVRKKKAKAVLAMLLADDAN
jgi:hypothetical protein